MKVTVSIFKTKGETEHSDTCVRKEWTAASQRSLLYKRLTEQGTESGTHETLSTVFVWRDNRESLKVSGKLKLEKIQIKAMSLTYSSLFKWAPNSRTASVRYFVNSTKQFISQ